MDEPSSRHGNEQQKRDGRGKGAIERGDRKRRYHWGCGASGIVGWEREREGLEGGT